MNTSDVVAVLIGALITVPASFMLFDRRAPVEHVSAEIIPPAVYAGDAVRLRWKIVEHRNCDGVSHRRIIDSTGKITEFETHPTVYHAATSPSPLTFEVIMNVPIGIAPGPARYDPGVFRWCNILQKTFWPIEDAPHPVPFTVLPSPKAPPIVILESR